MQAFDDALTFVDCVRQRTPDPLAPSPPPPHPCSSLVCACLQPNVERRAHHALLQLKTQWVNDMDKKALDGLAEKKPQTVRGRGCLHLSKWSMVSVVVMAAFSMCSDQRALYHICDE